MPCLPPSFAGAGCGEKARVRLCWSGLQAKAGLSTAQALVGLFSFPAFYVIVCPGCTWGSQLPAHAHFGICVFFCLGLLAVRNFEHQGSCFSAGACPKLLFAAIPQHTV